MSDRSPAIRAAFDLFGPPAGPCALCELPDKRHRLLDAVAESVLAGDTVRCVAENYDVAVDAVRAAVALGRITRREYERAGAPVVSP